MPTGALFRVDAGTAAGLDKLALIMVGLECAMEYPDVCQVVGGVRLWDSVVQGGGDIVLPRLVRVDNACDKLEGGGRCFIAPDAVPGYYSGRLRVELSNRTWKLVNSEQMVVEGSGACQVEVDVYGLVFVRAFTQQATPRTRHVVAEYLWDVSSRNLSTLWDWLVEQTRDAPPSRTPSHHESVRITAKVCD